ncbi:MAG: DNA-binding protein WhiA [Clostridiaceae bacterium]|jgi:DNA-binding transcriptional regulator WhiA|nr:DNA-binding protein WhiA [Clostridiaceae bacterium]
MGRRDNPVTFSRSVRYEMAKLQNVAVTESVDDASALIAAFATFAGETIDLGSDYQVSIRVAGSPLVRLVDKASKILLLDKCSEKKGTRDTVLTYKIMRRQRNILFFDATYWLKPDARHRLRAALSAAFMACGVISDPSSGRYRLVFTPIHESGSRLLFTLLSSIELVPGKIQQRGKTAVSLTNGDDIADFLRFCGAGTSLLYYEEQRSERELSGQVHRQLNFEDANLSRRVRSIESQLKAIDIISRTRGLDSLSPQLYEAAQARLANQGASLEELGTLMNPAVSKSGMSHRFSKLRAIAAAIHQEKP